MFDLRHEGSEPVDGRRLDAAAKALSMAGSRRRVLVGLLGATLPGHLGWQEGGALMAGKRQAIPPGFATRT